MCVAGWCDLAAHLVQPPAILRGKPRPMTSTSTRIPTSMLPAIDYFLPKRGRIMSNMNRLNNNNNESNVMNNNNNNNGDSSSYQTQNRHIDESLVFDPFSTNQSNYRNELWSTISLHEAIEMNYKTRFEELRRERIHNAMSVHIGLNSGNKQFLTKSLGSVDRFVNSSFLSSLHDMTISSSQRIEGETGAHKFLMQLCSKLSQSMEEEEKMKKSTTTTSSSSTQNNHHHMTKDQQKKLAEIGGGAGGAGKALLQLIASSQKHSNNVASAEALLQSAISEKTKKSSHHKPQKNALLDSIVRMGDTSSINNNNRSGRSTTQNFSYNRGGGDEGDDSSSEEQHQPNHTMLFTPDDLADLVDRCEVPLLVLRSVFQDIWKSTNNNNNNNNEDPSSANNQRLSWYPAQRSTAALISSAAKGSGKNTTAHNHGSKNDAVPGDNTNNNNNSPSRNQQNGKLHQNGGGTMALPKTSGISESISACISTLPVVDVATHVSRLEYSWRNAIDDQRATDLHHLTHLADYSKTKHKLTVVERQRNEALTKSDEASKKYNKLKNQIGLLCSREFMMGVGASSSMVNALPKITSGGGGGPSSPLQPQPPVDQNNNNNGMSPRRQSQIKK